MKDIQIFLICNFLFCKEVDLLLQLFFKAKRGGHVKIVKEASAVCRSLLDGVFFYFQALGSKFVLALEPKVFKLEAFLLESGPTS